MVWDPQDKPPANDNGCGAFVFCLGLAVGSFTTGLIWLCIFLAGSW